MVLYLQIDLDSESQHQDFSGSGMGSDRGYLTFKSRLNVPEDKNKSHGKDQSGDKAPF
jgi:hypothetical protein